MAVVMRGNAIWTLPTHQIVGMGEAFRLAKEEMQADREHVAQLHQRFLKVLMVLKKYVNGD